MWPFPILKDMKHDICIYFPIDHIKAILKLFNVYDHGKSVEDGLLFLTVYEIIWFLSGYQTHK